MHHKISIIILSLFFFSFVACDSTKRVRLDKAKTPAGYGQADFEVKIFQFGKESPVEGGQVYLQKEPFTIVLIGKYLDGIYSHTSFKENPTFSNPATKPVIESLASRVMAETAFNGDQELMASDDAYCYWFLDDSKSWHRLNRAFRVEEYTFLEKDVAQVWFIEDEKAVKLKELEENLFLYFFVAEENGKISKGDYIKVIWN